MRRKRTDSGCLRRRFRAAAAALLFTALFAGTAFADSPVVTVGSAPGGRENAAGPEAASAVAVAGAGTQAAAPVIVAGSGSSAEASGSGQGTEVSQVGPGGQTAKPDAETPEGAAADQGGTVSGTGETQGADGTAAETGDTQAAGRSIDPSRPMVALTYDDGPQTSVGNRIMDCLAQYGGKATFFMVGERVPARAAEVQRMVAEGHEVANHTMNHKYLQKQGAGVIQSQVAQCNDAIQAACGVRPTLMRLPGGGYNSTVLASTGMPMIQWSIDTLDWKHRNAATTVNKVLSQVKDGDIVLMHELYDATAAATEQIVPELVSRGYQLVTVSELAVAKGKALEAGKLYSAIR